MKTPASMRIWFSVMAAVLWLGICLTGFSTVNWLLYLPAAGLSFAGITGICPTQIAITALLNTRQKKDSSHH